MTVAVLDAVESRKFFGVPMARQHIQPVWLRIVNRSAHPYRLNLLAIDPNYFSPHEAAAANHYKVGTRLLEFGFLAFIFLPLLLFLPVKLLGGWIANRKMDTFFQNARFRLRPIEPGRESEGFVFTSLDAGNKIVHVRLLGHADNQEFVFTIPVPGLKVDYLRHARDDYPVDQLIECDIPALRVQLEKYPRATANRSGKREGDPVNLVIGGEFATIISAFGARWDETETITIGSSWKTFRVRHRYRVPLFAGQPPLFVGSPSRFFTSADSPID